MKKKTKKAKTHVSVAGLSISDITGITQDAFLHLKMSALQALTTRLVSAANKRIKRMVEAGELSPALRAQFEDTGILENTTGRKEGVTAIEEYLKTNKLFSTEGKNYNQLRKEFVKLKNFLDMKTSTLRGWNVTKRQTAKTLYNKYGIKVSPDKLADMMELYSKLKEIDPNISARDLKYEVLHAIAVQIKGGKTEDEILQDLQKRVEEIYKRQERNYADNGISPFFETSGKDLL